MKPAQRLSDLRPSPIRMLSEGAPPDAIPLGLGEPTWNMPEPARLALKAFKGTCPYGPNAGIPELRSTLAAFYGARPEEVFITCGSVGALYSLFQAWLDPGDAVLVPDPGFAVYPPLAKMAGAEVVGYPMNDADRFSLDADRLLATLAATPKAKIVILNHPANPTGAGARAADLARVADACEARGILLIADEVYRELWFGSRPPSLRELAPHAVVVSSVSKGWGSPGLRVGWAIGDPRWLEPARMVHAYAVTAAAYPAQKAAVALIETSDVVLPAARREVHLRFEALHAAMKTHLGVDIQPPAGAFYHWLPLPTSAHADPMAFCMRLRDEAKVVLVPGLTFGEGGRTFARLSFAASPKQIAEGVRRLAPFFR